MSLLGDEGDEAEGRIPPLLPPDDRLWRHPSELIQGGRAPAPVPGPARPGVHATGQASAGRGRRRQRLARPALAVTTGLLLGAGLTATTMSLTGSGTRPVPGGAALTSSRLSGNAGTGTTPGAASADQPPTNGTGGATVVTVGLESTPSGATGPVSPVPASTNGSRAGALASVSPAMAAGARRARASLVGVEADKGGAHLAGYGVETSTPGVVLTTESLVDGVDDVTVVDSLGDRMMATVVGDDPVTDVGVLRIETTTWSPIGISPGPARADQLVTALTTPDRIYLGELEATWVDADVPGHDPMLGALGSDVPIPADAIGAPLLDQDGRLVGIVGAVGVGHHAALAVPGATAEQAVGSLLSTGAVPHGWIGVERAEAVSGGVRVDQLESGAPAAEAGLGRGDVIAGVAGVPTAAVDDLWAAVRLRHPGTRVAMTVLRAGGRSTTLEVTLGDMTGH